MDWLKRLADVAPAIGSAFGPMGVAGGVAIRSILGLSPYASEDDLTAAFSNPENQIKLKTLELEYKAKQEAQETLRAQVDKDDRVSARLMQNEALKQEDVFAKRFIYFFSIFWSIASAFYIGMITFTPIPESNIRFADTILGFVLGTAIAQMFNFFLGSSSGSIRKDGTIYNLTKKS